MSRHRWPLAHHIFFCGALIAAAIFAFVAVVRFAS